MTRRKLTYIAMIMVTILLTGCDNKEEKENVETENPSTSVIEDNHNDSFVQLEKDYIAEQEKEQAQQEQYESENESGANTEVDIDEVPEDERWMYESELVDGEPTTVWDGTIDEEDYTNPYRTEEERQETADSIPEMSVNEAIEYENALIVKNRNDIDYTGITLESINPQKTRDQVIFGYISEDTLLCCYAVAKEQLGNVESIELSDWLTTVFYTERPLITTMVINGEHYKFVMTDEIVFMTDHI